MNTVSAVVVFNIPFMNNLGMQHRTITMDNRLNMIRACMVILNDTLYCKWKGKTRYGARLPLTSPNPCVS